MLTEDPDDITDFEYWAGYHFGNGGLWWACAISVDERWAYALMGRHMRAFKW